MAITGKDKSDASKDWSHEEEIQLFCAMENLKPVGIHKHFYMALILERLNNMRSSSDVWAHLGKMYDLKALDAQEPLPFSSEEYEPFSLPQPEFVLIKREPEIKVEPKSEMTPTTTKPGKHQSSHHKESASDKKGAKHEQSEPKRATKRTRGSTTSLESPASTPPPQSLSHKRRRI